MQQLAAARAQGCPSAGPAPSELREKLVQTDHTELNQVKTHSVNFNRQTVGEVKHLEMVVYDYANVFDFNNIFFIEATISVLINFCFVFSIDNNVPRPLYGSSEQDQSVGAGWKFST